MRSVQQECLDHLLIVNEGHLRRVLLDYVAHYNSARPHQGLAQQTPLPRPISPPSGSIQRRNILGGILHKYYRGAA